MQPDAKPQTDTLNIYINININISDEDCVAAGGSFGSNPYFIDVPAVWPMLSQVNALKFYMSVSITLKSPKVYMETMQNVVRLC